MTKFATIAPECEEVFDEVKGTDNLNYVIYEELAPLAIAGGRVVGEVYDSIPGSVVLEMGEEVGVGR
jgi:hypothetical protein